MKRGWTRFWLSVSGISLMAAIAAPPGWPQSGNALRRNHELRLAGLLPGRTAIAKAEILLGKASKRDSYNQSAIWKKCDGQELIVDLDGKGIVQQIRAVKNAGEQSNPDCSRLESGASKWATGAGLRIGHTTSRVLQLYGQPDSRSPSTKDGQRLELLYYAFDWAGPDVPQVMEVLCTVEKDGKPGRVVEITLAASSL